MKWNSELIGDVIERISTGKTPPTSNSDYFDGGIPWYTPGDIMNKTTLDESTRYISELAIKDRKATIFEPDTLLITCIGNIGRVGITTRLCSCNQQITGLKFKKNIDPLFAYYYFQFIQPILQQKSNSAVVPILNNAGLKEIRIKYPDLPTQQKIALLLSEADKARQLRKQANALTDQFLQSTFLDMFGDPAINEREFPKRELNFFYSKTKEGTKCGPFGSALKREEYTATGIPVWVMDNIKNGRFDPNPLLYIQQEKYVQLQSYKVENGDIIISRAGTVGKMCVVNTDFPESIISTNLISLSLDKDRLLPIYFVSLMTYFANRVGKLRKGEDGAFTHMNTGILNTLEIPVPPIKLQQQFADIVTGTEHLRYRQRAHEQELDQLFKGLLQKYFG